MIRRKAKPGPLLAVTIKNPAAVALGKLAHVGTHEAVIAKLAAMRRELGLPEWRRG